MLKKLASLLLSFLLCLSLLPGQVLAADEPAPVNPPAIVEPVDPEDPPVMPLVLDEIDTGHSGND